MPDSITKTVSDNRSHLLVMEERMSNLIRENSEEHKQIMAKIDEVCRKLDKQFVTKTEFRPYKLAWNLIAGTFVLAIVGAIIKLVILQ